MLVEVLKRAWARRRCRSSLAQVSMYTHNIWLPWQSSAPSELTGTGTVDDFHNHGDPENLKKWSQWSWRAFAARTR